MNLLFVCNQGRNRSRSAAELLEESHETRYAGLYSERPLSKVDLVWADVIFVMEEFQRREIASRFPDEYLKKQILSLDIPDMFSYNDPELLELLEARLRNAQPLLELRLGFGQR
jgi:predicted protein tyrosine phosphatase